jgi:crotonobetainyl-CoA:carnitine CoA-transferase CaiB-like acyl-CoA transferase
VFPAAGEDEWCVVTVRDDADWRALCGVIGEPESAGATRAERLANKVAIEAHLAQWLAGRDPHLAAQTLQAAGVPAAPMLRVSQQPEYPYFAERGMFRVDTHDLLPEPLVAERRPAICEALADAPSGPAPLMGQDTIAVIRDWLHLDEAELVRLEADGILETVSDKIRSMIADGSYRETGR